MLKSLQASQNPLGETSKQLELIQNAGITPFQDRLKSHELFPLKTKNIGTFQINMGKMCNQVCEHCHVDAGPDRKEIMTRETMQECLDAVAISDIHTVDLTGGAPEMNPDFRWFVEQLSSQGKHILVRCNLTIIVANIKHNDLPEFFKKHKIEVVSSLPCYTEANTDKQRGEGVFAKSIKALQMLNKVGYGMEGSGLTMNLVYNPSGASLPGNQMALEADYKKRLKTDFDIEFNHLFTITNLPVSRFLDYLVKSGNYEEYMNKLADSYNAQAASNVMCREMVSIGWDGYIYDCDFNQMLELKVATEGSRHIRDYNQEALLNREIIVNQHCFGCTAGEGSSCGGATA